MKRCSAAPRPSYCYTPVRPGQNSNKVCEKGEASAVSNPPLHPQRASIIFNELCAVFYPVSPRDQ